MKQLPAAMKHNRTTQDELHILSVVLRVFSYPHKYSVALPNQGK